MAGLSTIKILLTVAAVKGWEIHHCDYTNAYPNAKLKTPVYVRCPQRYEDLDGETLYYSLEKSLYGLIRENWNELLDGAIH